LPALPLKEREAVLEDAFVYERRIDAETYDSQRDRLREEIALARMELHDAQLEEIDVEGILGFAEHVLENAAQLWLESSPEHRERLQNALFPEGLRLVNGRFGTAVTCLAFATLAISSHRKSGVASPTGTALALEAEMALTWEVAE
jgi:hypothetical protein